MIRKALLGGLLVALLIVSTTVAFAQVPTATPVPAPMGKCQWLSTEMPQTTDGVKAWGVANAQPAISTQRVRPILYVCGSTTVFQGYIILGPNEGFEGEVEVSVPEGGAIESYVGASYTGLTEKIGPETIRAHTGVVTGLSLSIYWWNDKFPPTK